MSKKKEPIDKRTRFSARHYFDRPHRPPLIREHWVRDLRGDVVRYGLAFIDHSLYPGDHGRVLGYDNAHGVHERHFKGETEIFAFDNYENVLERFLDEVRRLRGATNGDTEKG
jgi:hypothetical protein